MRRKHDPAFLELQSEWDKKLRDSGFKDAECRRTGLLRSWTGYSALYANPAATLATPLTHTSSRRSRIDVAAYYRMAGVFLYEKASWENEVDRDAWQLHCEGRTNREVSAVTGMSLMRLKNLLRRLRGEMLGALPTIGGEKQ